jgi:FkbM family methyltransferase
MVIPDDVASTERALKEGLIFDYGNIKILYKLGLLCYYSGRFTESKFYYSKAIAACTETDFKEQIKKELLTAERSIQFDLMNETLHHLDFLDLLVKELLDNSANDFHYNIDFELFELMGVPAVSDALVVNTHDERSKILKHLQGIANLYHCLADQASRDLLIKLLAFRIMGNKKVILPLNTREYWLNRQSLRKLISSTDKIKTKYHQWDLHSFHLSPLGYDINLYCFPVGLSATFVDKQYEYNKITPAIKADPGDIVIDAGGCFGDTALYFAHEVGETGHVYTIEFIPSNLEIMKKNRIRNVRLQELITIVEYPVWSHSDQLLYYMDQGPASFVAFSKTSEVCEETLTLSIDDLVKHNKIHRVDFIKMDIEGAELNALKGAQETLETFRPKLAITIYHQISDFEDISRYISNLNLGYRFFLGHYTIYAQETVLFAISEK